MRLTHLGEFAISVLLAAGMFAGIGLVTGAMARTQMQRMGSPMLTRASVPGAPDAPDACPISRTQEGVDVSHYDGSINWDSVAAAGRSFAYTKITEGTIYTDPTYITNYMGIKNAGMKAGGYMFFHPAQDPVDQANLFVSRLRRAGFAPGDLGPEIDVEITEGEGSTTIASNLLTVVHTIQGALGITPVIYTAAAFWNQDVSSTQFRDNPLWTVQWSTACPSIATGWNTWTIWQYSASGIVSGISALVDLDRTNGSRLPIYNASQTFLPIVLAQ